MSDQRDIRMTELPTPRYNIGQVVYRPNVEPTSEQLPCPDCLGEQCWRVSTPSGTEHVVDCPRCRGGYSHSGIDKLPPLTIRRYAPGVRRLTIGSITAKTHPYHGNDPIEYMAQETGVGSGSIYRERNLYSDEASALAAAQQDAAARNAEIDALPEAIAARRFSSLKLQDAALDRLKDGLFDAWAAFRNLVYSIEELLPEDANSDNEEQRQIREAVDRYGRAAGTYLPPERHVIDELLAARAPEDVAAAIDKLKQALGLDLRPEPPPCECRHATKYLFNPACPRHGRQASGIV